MLLHRRSGDASAQVFYLGSDMDRLDRFEREVYPGIHPLQEQPNGRRIGLPGMRLPDLGREELHIALPLPRPRPGVVEESGKSEDGSDPQKRVRRARCGEVRHLITPVIVRGPQIEVGPSACLNRSRTIPFVRSPRGNTWARCLCLQEGSCSSLN